MNYNFDLSTYIIERKKAKQREHKIVYITMMSFARLICTLRSDLKDTL